MKIIEIFWEGPKSIEEIMTHVDPDDYGLYQVYGNHPVHGSNVLLYIGQANDHNFGKRIPEHVWLKDESSEISYYIGKIGSVESQLNDPDWKGAINLAERQLIYFCTPPYNANGIFSTPKETNVIVINFGKNNRLPYVVSSLYYQAIQSKKEGKWNFFEFKNN